MRRTAILPLMRLSVSVQEDHLASLLRAPLEGLSELIWNALDADADNVTVTFDRNALGGVDAIHVADDGHGMNPAEIAAAFDRLGGSWKLRADRSKTKGRSLHGKKGQGRWRSLGIGGMRVVWTTVAEVDGRRIRSRIEIKRGSLRDAEVSPPEETDDPLGTVATVDGLTDNPQGLMGSEAPLNLTARFALHLLKYPTVAVRFDGRQLDPKELVASLTELPLDGPEASLTIIEWKQRVRDHTLYLCDPEGVTLHEVPAGVQPPGVNYSAYLKARAVRDLEDQLLLIGFDPEGLGPLVAEARAALRRHFNEREAQRAQEVIQGWRTEKVYPFAEPAVDEVDSVKRQLFDVVAYTASKAVNSSKDPSARRLSLRLIEQALQSEPTELRHIFEEVLKLPKEQMEWLDGLLQQTTLTAIVTAAHRIAGRLQFLAGLEYLLFDEKMKPALKERSQLHKIVRSEPWIFGEEFALAVDDRSLNEVLTQHRRILGDDVSASDAPVLDSDGKVRIVDLMFGGSMKQARQRREHLVVELKRPSVKVGSDELTQITKYAVAVTADPRFNIKDVDWDFWVVSDELDDYAIEMTHKEGLPGGQYHRSKEGNIRVWAVPWAEILENASHRLKFVQEQLNYIATGDDAIAYLQRVYQPFLPAVAVDAAEA